MKQIPVFFLGLSLGIITAALALGIGMKSSGARFAFEKKYAVTAAVGGFSLDVKCTTASTVVEKYRGRYETQVVVNGHGYRANTGYVGSAVVTLIRNTEIGADGEVDRTPPYIYTDFSRGYVSYNGMRAHNDKVSDEIVAACMAVRPS